MSLWLFHPFGFDNHGSIVLEQQSQLTGSQSQVDSSKRKRQKKKKKKSSSKERFERQCMTDRLNGCDSILERRLLDERVEREVAEHLALYKPLIRIAQTIPNP